MAKFKLFVCYVLIAFSILGMFPKEVFAVDTIDYAHPNFEGHKFIMTVGDGTKKIEHKFKFGTGASAKSFSLKFTFSATQPAYKLKDMSYYDNYQTHAGPPLNEKYKDKVIELYGADQLNGKSIINKQFINLLVTQGDNQVIGFHVVQAYDLQTFAGFPAGTWCPPEIKGAGGGTPLYGTPNPNVVQGVGEAVGTDTDELARSCFRPASPYQIDGGHNVLIDDDNFKEYVYQLGSNLWNNPVTATLGAGSVDMKVTDTALINKCKTESGLDGPINTNHSELIDTFLESILEPAVPDAQKTIRDFLNAPDVKIDNRLDEELFNQFYASPTNSGYANKYIDEGYENTIMGIVQEAYFNQAYELIWAEKTLTENYMKIPTPAEVLVPSATTAAAVGGAGYVAYRGAPIYKSLTEKMAASSRPLIKKLATRMGVGSAGMIALVGAILIFGALVIYHHAKDTAMKNHLRSMYKLWYIKTYLAANYENQLCTGLMTKYPEQENTYTTTMQSIDAAIASGNEVTKTGSESYGSSGACAHLKGSYLDIAAQIKFAFCGLGLMLKEFAEALFKNALDMLTKSMGYVW